MYFLSVQIGSFLGTDDWKSTCVPRFFGIQRFEEVRWIVLVSSFSYLCDLMSKSLINNIKESLQRGACYHPLRVRSSGYVAYFVPCRPPADCFAAHTRPIYTHSYHHHHYPPEVYPSPSPPPWRYSTDCGMECRYTADGILSPSSSPLPRHLQHPL